MPSRGSDVSTPSTRARSRVGDQGRRRALEQLPHRRGRRRAAPVLDDGDPQAGQVVEVLAEAGLPAAHRGQAERIAGIVAVGDVEPAGGVAHAAREAAGRDGEVAVTGERAERDAAEGALEADEAGEPGRDADGPAAVAARGEGDEAAGDGRRAAARRATRRAVQRPGVAGGAMELGAGEVHAAELAGRREPYGNGPTGGPQAGDHGGVDLADLVAQRHGWRGCRASRRRARAP